MMVAAALACLKSLLKLVNSIMGIVGMALILYGLWLLRVWHREMDIPSPSYDFTSTSPWFAYTSMGTGVFFCVITCLGHMAADSINDCCLSCYMLIIVLLLLLEGAVAADILLNSKWENDLPEDPTGTFEGFKDFVATNMEICKWIGLVIISAQGLSILLAMALRAIGANQGWPYGSDDDYAQVRLPLLNHVSQQPQYAVGGSRIACNNKTSRNVGKKMKNGVPNFWSMGNGNRQSFLWQ